MVGGGFIMQQFEKERKKEEEEAQKKKIAELESRLNELETQLEDIKAEEGITKEDLKREFLEYVKGELKCGYKDS